MDTVTPEVRSRMMANIRSKDTKPEILVRHALHRLGFRYRKNVRGMPGTPDLVFPRRKAVVQVFGCFWHCHSCRAGSGKIPKSNTEFWAKKFAANWARDRRDILRLREMGYLVIVVWECRLKKSGLEREVTRIAGILNTYGARC